MTFDQTADCPYCDWTRTVPVHPDDDIKIMERTLFNAKALAKRYVFDHVRRAHRAPADPV